jgi:hypothetical protein
MCPALEWEAWCAAKTAEQIRAMDIRGVNMTSCFAAARSRILDGFQTQNLYQVVFLSRRMNLPVVSATLRGLTAVK